MKKLTAIVLTIVLFVLSLSTVVQALPLSSGTAALNAQFLDGVYPNICDTVFFSPVKGEEDTTKYPLMVWLHGMKSGTAPREQLRWYEFSNWCSDEYQARFGALGGCFLFAPRSDNAGNDWSPSLTAELKTAIDYFIAENYNHIDTTRIYIGGYSTGGGMVWDMLMAYPDFFAAGIPIAAVTQPQLLSLNRMSNISVWMISSDNDYHQLAESSDVKPVFQKMKSITNRPTGVRWTTVSEAFYADGRKKCDETGAVAEDCEHYIWECVTFDMHMLDGVTPYVNCTTVDAAGNRLSFTDPSDGVIRWLAGQQKSTDDGGGKELNFFERIVRFFQDLFAQLRALFVL